jgi:hypothetical protein
MMIRRGREIMAALTLLIGAAGCGAGGAGIDPNGQSVVVIHVDLDPNVTTTLYQIEVQAHLGTGARDNTLFFPPSPNGRAIASGDTLALLISPTIMDSVDLVLYGRDAQNNRQASGTGQAKIVTVGAEVDTTVTLSACATSGC